MLPHASINLGVSCTVAIRWISHCWQVHDFCILFPYFLLQWSIPTPFFKFIIFKLFLYVHFYGLRSLREYLVDLHCYNMINIANDSHGHLFSFQYDSCLIMIFVILLLCFKINDIYVRSTLQLPAKKLNFSACRMLEFITSLGFSIQAVSMISKENDLGITFTCNFKFRSHNLQDSTESKQGFRYY